jgi:hypothetical protein
LELQLQTHQLLQQQLQSSEHKLPRPLQCVWRLWRVYEGLGGAAPSNGAAKNPFGGASSTFGAISGAGGGGGSIYGGAPTGSELFGAGSSLGSPATPSYGGGAFSATN